MIKHHKLKDKAISMRLRGMDLPAIAILLKISKSTASLWLRNTTTPAQFITRKSKIRRPVKITIIVGEKAKLKLRMKNGKYSLVRAPLHWPGKKYRDKYAYEHHVNYWLYTGMIPKYDEVIHHINGDYRDNAFENLKLMTNSQHTKFHAKERRKLFRSSLVK